MNPDPDLVSDPIVILLAWAGGVALAGAVVSALRVVGPGFTWLVGGTTVMIAIWPALSGDSRALGAVAAAALGALVARWDLRLAGVLLAAAAILLVWSTALWSGLGLAVTATAALGGITAEMLLGHWYLVDPTLPRTVLANLAYLGIAGAALDGILAAALVGLPADGFLVGVLIVLVVTTIGLMVAVVGALRYPAYSGVMAATGLSYLAVLTGLAAVFFSRLLPTNAALF